MPRLRCSYVANRSIIARNLPEHANNPIHTDVGAQAAGFERALVAGVTSYAYCLHPVIHRFGLGWVARGEAEVHFRRPVFDGDHVFFPLRNVTADVSAEDAGEEVKVSAQVKRSERALVQVSAWSAHRPSGFPGSVARSGEELQAIDLILDGEFGSTYAEAAGVLDDLCAREGVVHPAVWPALANYVFHRQLARGSWIHTRSVIRHFALVPEGVTARIVSTVIDRISGRNERAIADVLVLVDDMVVASVEHEAIVHIG
jgi:acyl dehydratase